MHSELVVIHRLFRRIQQKNKFVLTKEVTGLSLLETHFLIELQASNESLMMADLSKVFRLEQSIVSRMVSSLKKRKFLAVSPQKEDPRRKKLTLTKQAKKVISVIDKDANERIARLSKGLKVKELKSLIFFLNTIADGYGEKKTPQRPEESSFRVAQRRITRALKLLGEDVYESALNSSEWQVLSEVALVDPVPVRITELSELIQIPQNHLSTIIDKLEQRKLLVRKKDERDKRITNLALLKAGGSLYRSIEKKSVAKLAKILSELSSQDISYHTNLLKKYSNETTPHLPPLTRDYALSFVKKSKQYENARGAVARILVGRDEEMTIPETLLPKKNTIYMLHYKEQVAAVFELAGNMKFGNEVIFSCWKPEISPWILLGCLNQMSLYSDMDSVHQLKSVIKAQNLRKYLSL